MLNETHDPQRRTWVTGAEGSDFPIQNLPFGRFRRGTETPRAGVAIGDYIVDLRAASEANVLTGEAQSAALIASGNDLTPLLAAGNGPASALRRALSGLLALGGDGEKRSLSLADRILVPRSSVEMLLPLRINQFSDMCVSTFHIGRRNGVDERGEPNCPRVFRSQPVGYDGRASSVVVSGARVRRPHGQWLETPGSAEPQFGPEPRQDYELELAIWMAGPGNPLGTPQPIRSAGEKIFGYGLLNDWSARGIQMWENMLGPFLGKSLATTVSPWIVTTEALAPFRTAAFPRPTGDPQVPAHLFATEDQAHGGLDVSLEAELVTPEMWARRTPPFRICGTNTKYMYWTPAQMAAHHTSNGCSLAAGDLLGSGTCSGPAIEEAGCLLERTMVEPLTLPTGEVRQWLEDGDVVILRGRAERSGFVSIGFGEAWGQISAVGEYPS